MSVVKTGVPEVVSSNVTKDKNASPTAIVVIKSTVSVPSKKPKKESNDVHPAKVTSNVIPEKKKTKAPTHASPTVVHKVTVVSLPVPEPAPVPAPELLIAPVPVPAPAPELLIAPEEPVPEPQEPVPMVSGAEITPEQVPAEDSAGNGVVETKVKSSPGICIHHGI